MDSKFQHIDTITCLECGCDFKTLNSHINFKHNLNWKQYKSKHPDTEMIGGDLLKTFQKKALIMAKSKEAAEGRRKYWNHKENRTEKSVFMKSELERRLKDPKFYKGFRGKGIEALNETAQKKFKKAGSKRKKCKQCGKVMTPRTYLSKDGYIKHYDVGMTWERKKYCGRPCQYESMKGRVFSEEHRKNLGLASKGRVPWNKGIHTNG